MLKLALPPGGTGVAPTVLTACRACAVAGGAAGGPLEVQEVGWPRAQCSGLVGLVPLVRASRGKPSVSRPPARRTCTVSRNESMAGLVAPSQAAEASTAYAVPPPMLAEDTSLTTKLALVSAAGAGERGAVRAGWAAAGQPRQPSLARAGRGLARRPRKACRRAVCTPGAAGCLALPAGASVTHQRCCRWGR